jgi:hypothetical protein
MGRPRKYNTSEDTLEATRAGRRASYHRRRNEEIYGRSLEFIIYEPRPDDVPPPTCSATGLRSDLSIPTADDTPALETPAVLISRGQPRDTLLLPLPPPIQRNDNDKEDEGEDKDKDYETQELDEPVDEEYEAEINARVARLEIDEGQGRVAKAWEGHVASRPIIIDGEEAAVIGEWSIKRVERQWSWEGKEQMAE